MTTDRLLDALDRLVAHAAEFTEGPAVDRAAEVALYGRRRLGYLGDGLVVALAGGTGSGKSSLLNAVAGDVVTESGPIRPTTSTAKAWVPRTAEPGIVRLLDDMGVSDVVEQDVYPNLTILDMPDTDSVVGAHRELFQKLLPRVDAVIWVVDPEKYNDRLLHEEYLRPLADYEDQFVFVFNQVDRLNESEQQTVIKDFADRLRIDGLTDPVVVATAAAPVHGEPVGVANLMAELEDRLDAKRLVTEKLALDARSVATELHEAAGLGAEAIDFDERWPPIREQVVQALAELVAGTEVETVAVRSGRAIGHRRATGPLGALASALKDSAVGRLLGFERTAAAPEIATSQWDRRAGLEGVYSLLDRFVGDIASALSGSHGARLRQSLPSPETPQAVARVVDGSLVDRPFPDLEAAVPGWLRALGVLKWILAGAFVAGAIWMWAVPPTRGEWPWSVILMVGSIVAGLLISRGAEGIGGRGGRIRTRQFREVIEEHLAAGLDREFGAVMRTHVRDKAIFAAKVEEVRDLAAATLARMETPGT